MITRRELSLAIVVGLIAWAAAGQGAEQSSFGDAPIPAGAILGWLPPEQGASIPAGWMVCSRANQVRYPWVPDLSTQGRFLRASESPFPGTEAFDGGVEGGSPRHSHSTARRSVAHRRVEKRTSGQDRAATETHTHVTDLQGHLPPHVKVVFLCKCRSSDCSSG